MKRQDTFARKLSDWCWTELLCLLFGMDIRDINCAFKLYKREIFENIELYSTSAVIDFEILAELPRKVIELYKNVCFIIHEHQAHKL